MFNKKRKTILTSKRTNEMVNSERPLSLSAAELTSPAAMLYINRSYICVGGVTMPLNK